MDRNRDCDITLVHVTDGSPRDLADARKAGLRSRRAYAAARRRELHDALRLVGIGRRQLRVFSYVDKESHLHLPELITRMASLIDELRPPVVFSPAYEGGHPDHDSAALAVAAARQRAAAVFRHREYPLYHAGPGGAMVTQEFLPSAGTRIDVCRLSGAEQEKKRAMLARFTTQQHILKEFAVSNECFRDAPTYDFSRPPHAGMLLYEYWNFGVSGEQWRARAREALASGAGNPTRSRIFAASLEGCDTPDRH